MITEPTNKENLQETIDAIKIKNNPYFICVIDFSKNKEGTYLSTVKGKKEDIYLMIQTLLTSLL